MVSVTKSADMTLPLLGMLLTRLFEHVRVNHPYSFLNELYLVDHVMIPLSEKRIFRFKHEGKRPRLLTPTPSNSESFDSPSPTPYQGMENDPFKELPWTFNIRNLVGESSPNPITSNPKRRNRRRSKQPFSLEESPIDTMVDQRTMVELLRAPTEGYARLRGPRLFGPDLKLSLVLIGFVPSFTQDLSHPQLHILIGNS
ncbi:hypothetical protein Tco_0454253 [Tanacetum coccineum]